MSRKATTLDGMVNYDAIKEVFLLKRDRAGVIIERVPVPLEAFLWLVDADGNIPELPYPACQIRTQGLPQLLTKDDIEVRYHEQESQAQ